MGLCAYYFLFSEKSAYKKVSYSEFYESVNQNEVIKAELSENKILYELKDGTKTGNSKSVFAFAERVYAITRCGNSTAGRFFGNYFNCF